MKKGQTSVWTGSFVQVLASNFFLFAALFFVMPTLPEWISRHTSLDCTQSNLLLLGIPLGMILIGPFNAFLFEKFRRKSVGMLAILVMSVIPLGYMYATEIWQYACLITLQGMAFSSALNLDIGVHIDVTSSEYRKTANAFLVKTAVIAQTVGYLIGHLVHDKALEIESCSTFFNTAAALGFIPLLFILAVKVPFRAPIEIKPCTLDKFWLPSAFVLTANLMLFAFSVGLLIMNRQILTAEIDIIIVSKIAIILVLTLLGIPKVMQMYMGLATHCQRCTANSTLFLTWILSLIAGGITAAYLASLDMTASTRIIAISGLIISVGLFLTVIKKYYKKHQRKDEKYDI